MKRAWLLLISAAALQSGFTALADTTLHASIDETHDDNLFRLSDSDPSTPHRDDVYRRGEIGVRSEINPGRQQMSLAANAYNMKFQHFDYLDNTGGAADALWNWTVGNQWQGNLGYTYNRGLASFEVQENEANIRTDHHPYIHGGYRFHPSWRARFGYDDLHTDFSSATSRPLNFDGKSTELALDYVAPSENTLGVRVRRIDGNLPNPQAVGTTLVNNSYTQNDVGLTLEWRMSGYSRLFGGVDYTNREHEQLPQRDYTGPTGRLNFDWGLPETLIWHFAVWWRLTESDNDLTATYVLADGLLIGPSWAVTSKIKLDATAMHIRREFRGDPAVVLLRLTTREDIYDTAHVTLSYLVTSKFGVNLSYAVERRTSNVALADYDDRIINAGLRVQF